LSCPVSVTFSHALTGERIEAWQLGPSGKLLQGHHSGQLARRTERHVRIGGHEKVSFSVNFRGSSAVFSRDHHAAQNGEVRILDLTSPYERRHLADSASCAFEIDYTALGLSTDVVRSAVPHAAASPLHALAANHLMMLPRVLDQPGSARALPMLAETTTQLMRALVAAVTLDHSVRSQALAETQLSRVDAYIAQRLRDPALSVAEIAASQFMSLRQLYSLFAQRSSTPSEWIISRRLAGACEDLSRRPDTQIRVLAMRWGFRSADHFTRRFRAAYGMAPSAWVEQFKTTHDLT
jgi:AraC-like DNA-binding protein